MKKIRPGSELPNGRLILKLRFKKGSVEEKDDEDGATSVRQVIAWWHLPFTDVNLVSSACGTKSSWRVYWKKKWCFVIAGTFYFVFRYSKFIFNILVEDLNPKVSKLVVSWHSWLIFFFWFGLYCVNCFLEEYATLCLKATLPFFLSLTTKLFHTPVSI